MSDYIPFEIQSEIIKMLPVKSLIQFRSVSKQWKSLIDNPEFINNYHINHTKTQHHLLLSYKPYKMGKYVNTYTSIVDNNTFPQHKFPLTAPESLSSLRDTETLGSVNGLLCFCGLYGDVEPETKMAVIWNPTVRKSVGIVIPNPKAGYKHTIVGFGVCPDTSDPKLVNIGVIDRKPSMWEVAVFTLSTRVWKTVYAGAPFKKYCDLMCHQVSVNGVIYFRDSVLSIANRVRSNIIISFDIKSEMFGEVCLPERLVRTRYAVIDLAKVNGSLGLLEYYEEGDMRHCGVWTRTDDANKTFSKIYTVKVECKSVYDRVLGFSNNGDVVMELADYNSKYAESRIEVYEPLSGHINGVGINGRRHTFSARSYMETLLLLNESDSTIH